MVLRISAVLLLAWFAVGNTSRAADQPALPKELTDPETQRRIVEAAKRSTVFVNNPCPSAQFTVLPQVHVLQPANYDASGAIIGGAWHEAVRDSGCGVDRILNVVAFVQQPRTLGTMPMLPGTTTADFQLQRDAVRYAVIAAGGPEKDCSTGYISDTKFIGLKGAPINGGKSPPWDEQWTLTTCTKQAVVTMHFIPDSTGTTISAGQAETKFQSIGPK